MAATRSVSGVAWEEALSPSPLKRKLAVRDDHRRPADRHPLDLAVPAVYLRVQGRGPVDLGALGDLDLLPKFDQPVPEQVHGQGAGRSPGGPPH